MHLCDATKFNSSYKPKKRKVAKSKQKCYSVHFLHPLKLDMKLSVAGEISGCSFFLTFLMGGGYDHKMVRRCSPVTRISLLLVMVFVCGCSSRHDLSFARIGCNGTLELGTISKGGIISKTLLLTNEKETFELTGFKTSCPCLSCTLEPLRLSKGEVGNLKLTMDMKKEPEYSGSLWMTVKGLDNAGKCVIEIQVLAEVVDK